MTENSRILMEVGFNIFYLIFIWYLTVKMFSFKDYNIDNDNGVGSLLRVAFLLLAIGDTGHVGFRVWAYALGDISSSASIFGWQLPLVGAGALSTSITITFFYVILLEASRKRFSLKAKFLYFTVVIVAIFRLQDFIEPNNEWANVVPPIKASLWRNGWLTIMGLLIAFQMLYHSIKNQDKFFIHISILIFFSFAFYIPVILFVQKAPMIGMLMIPKTIAYLLMAVAVRKEFFLPNL